MDAINGEGTIKVNTNYDDNNIFVCIQDNGTGIDDTIIKKIFDPFVTTKQVGEGTGLGLSVSYGIIKKFNGEINVKSTLDKGSEFIIQIPY